MMQGLLELSGTSHLFMTVCETVLEILETNYTLFLSLLKPFLLDPIQTFHLDDFPESFRKISEYNMIIRLLSIRSSNFMIYYSNQTK